MRNILNIILLVISILLTSCDSVIYTGEGDCDPIHIIKFRYDMNMKFADAFFNEVTSVNLYVFDEDGNLVNIISEDVLVHNNEYSIELRNLPRGYYNLLAWCNVKDNTNFNINNDYACQIFRIKDNNETSHIHNDIGRMFFGRLDNVNMTQDEGRYEHVINLIKDTNVIRVTLQHLSGKPMDKDDYDISIIDNNGFYNCYNELLPDEYLTYHPWNIRSGISSFHKEDEPDNYNTSNISAVIAELTTGRLMESHRNDVKLLVKNKKTQEHIISIPLIDYLLLVKGYYYSKDGITPMSDQEYLDRQDDYPITFFLDEKDEWLKTIIYINSWRIVINDENIH